MVSFDSSIFMIDVVSKDVLQVIVVNDNIVVHAKQLLDFIYVPERVVRAVNVGSWKGRGV